MTLGELSKAINNLLNQGVPQESEVDIIGCDLATSRIQDKDGIIATGDLITGIAVVQIYIVDPLGQP